MATKVLRSIGYGVLAVVLTASLTFAGQQKAEQQKKADTKKPKNSDIDNIGNRNINKGNLNFTSLEKEIALGRQLAAEVERQVKLIDDAEINEFVNRVGQNLVRNSDAQVPFSIKIVESDEINAFALPGGFFFVNSGLVLAADDESELASVMAHEIAHVTARHGTEQYTKGQIVNYATLPLIFLGGVGGFAARQAAGFLIPLQFLQFSRSAEAEADYLGLQYLYKTGYEPNAAVTFFEKIQARETAKPGTISKMFRSHPPTDDRITKIKSEIGTVLPAKPEYVITTSEFNRVKARLAALENRKPAESDDKPSLRRKTNTPVTDDEEAGEKTETGTSKDGEKKEGEKKDEDRPKLKRRK